MRHIKHFPYHVLLMLLLGFHHLMKVDVSYQGGHKDITNVVQSQGQPISGQKRNLEEFEENSRVFAKRIHASQIDGQKNYILVEADSQPRQQQ